MPITARDGLPLRLPCVARVGRGRRCGQPSVADVAGVCVCREHVATIRELVEERLRERELWEPRR